MEEAWTSETLVS